MKLKRLIIQGFKSFKDKTIIHFDDGITGIVGPNGCGKSNIVDALFWVMGEQSAKHLRGSKMQDLIFSGSSKYNPSSWAEVSLVLSNEKGKHIHIGQKLTKPSEIQITRKLYRNGETEYRINNFPCRLKDIHEVFMDTGAGAKSYSIIAQGEINRLVQAKPVERRTMIEEVAGVTKFKVRRKESLKKIDNTQLNLDRLSDLQAEIYKQLKKLEVQAEKAQRARNLKEKLERHELIVTSHKEYDLLTSFRDLKEGAIKAEEELEELKMRKNSLEISLEDERIIKEEKLEALNARQAEFNEKSKELAAGEERLNYFERDKVEKEKLAERTQEEIEELKEVLDSRRERLEGVKLELVSVQEESTNGIDVEEMQTALEVLQEQRDNAQEKVNDLNLENDQLLSSRSQTERELATVEAQAQEFSRSLEELTLEVEELEKESSAQHSFLSDEKDKLSRVTSQRNTLQNQISETQQELSQVSQTYQELELELKDLSKDHVRKKSQWESLKAVNDSSVGSSEGYKKFFEDFKGSNVAKLGELIETPAEFGTPVDSLLGEWLNLVLEKEPGVNEWLSSNSDSRIDIIKDAASSHISTETITRLETLGAQDIRPLSDIVTIASDENSDWKKTITQFLEGFFIVGNLDVSLMEDISSSINFKGLVSLDGKFVMIKNHGLVVKRFKGSQDNQLGFVQRNNQLRELQVVVEELEQKLNHKEPQFEEFQEIKISTSKKLEELRETYNQVNSEYHALKSALEAKESFAGSNSAKLERLLLKKSDVSMKRVELVEREETLINNKEELSARFEDFDSTISEAKEVLHELQMNFQTKREEFVSIKVQMDSFEGRKLNIINTKKDIDSEIERYSLKLEDQTQRLEDTRDEFTTILETIEDLKTANVEQAEMLSAEETGLLEFKDSLDEILVKMQDREEEVKSINSRVNTLEKEFAVANSRFGQIIEEEEILTRDIFERYQVNLRDVIVKNIELREEITSQLKVVDDLFEVELVDGLIADEKDEYLFEKKFPGQVKESREKFRRYKSDINRLGEINWQAVEDYDRQKVRYEFLTKQEEELKASLEDLQSAIDHIDSKSRIRFKEAFEEVNMRFQKVFPIIFGGGSATLKLVGSMDDADSGIDIIAQPPGKKMQNINLMSGGEKAMTAVSLIFSIFLVKPSPFCLLDEVDAPLDDANVGRFNELLREMSSESQFILITHNKKTMELNDVLYGVTMQEPGISKAVSVQLQ